MKKRENQPTMQGYIDHTQGEVELLDQVEEDGNMTDVDAVEREVLENVVLALSTQYNDFDELYASHFRMVAKLKELGLSDTDIETVCKG